MVDEKEGDGKPALNIFDDVAKILFTTDPADMPNALNNVAEERTKTWNQATARRLYQESERMLRELLDEEHIKNRADTDCIVALFDGSDPEPLVRRLISGPPLSRLGELRLASALASIAMSDGGGYGRILKVVPKRRGRPLKGIMSEEVVEVADRVAEVQKVVGKKELAVGVVAEEMGISTRSVWKFLENEDWAREDESG
ncbi:MAG: hypothetical protein JNM75_05000 [Rhodospirillales bacterium]|nr:hypothetical protein [Rhodospirillales bacterium]